MISVRTDLDGSQVYPRYLGKHCMPYEVRPVELALDGCSDFRRAGDRRFQVGRGGERVENRTRDVVVDFGGAADVDRVANDEFESGCVGELQARLGLWRLQRHF